jgi:hypothetical protein
VPLITARSAADTPAKLFWSMLANRALACVSAVPAVPPEISAKDGELGLLLKERFRSATMIYEG